MSKITWNLLTRELQRQYFAEIAAKPCAHPVRIAQWKLKANPVIGAQRYRLDLESMQGRILQFPEHVSQTPNLIRG